MGASVKRWLWGALLAVASPAHGAMIDPTAPPRLPAAASTDGVPAAELAWVRVNGKQSLAWYGGSTVGLGDPVEGGRVTAIREDHIVITGNQGRRTVYLLDPAARPRQWIKQR